jgi:hypothetical protein
VVRNCWLDRGWEEKEPRKFEGEFFRFVGHGVGPFLLVGGPMLAVEPKHGFQGFPPPHTV